eukprot:2800582-Prymnesium_polylepis.1
MRSKVHGVGLRGAANWQNFDMGGGFDLGSLEEESSIGETAGKGAIVSSLAEQRRLDAIKAVEEEKQRAAAEK